MNTTELQEKLNTYNDKKLNLKTKAWFRVVQVIYVLGAITASVASFSLIDSTNKIMNTTGNPSGNVITLAN